MCSSDLELRRINLITLKPRLADAEFKELTRLQQGLHRDQAQGKELTLTAVQGVGAVINNMAQQVGVHKDPKKMGLIYADAQRRISEAETLKGARLTPQEQSRVVAQTFEKLSVEGFLWNSNKPAWAITAKDKLALSEKERAEIEAALKRSGRPVTEDNVQMLYRRSKGL